MYVESVEIAALYNGIGVFGEPRLLQRDGDSLEAGKRFREMEGRRRIRAWVLAKLLSFSS